MRQYLDLLQNILHTGERQSNRTGIDTLTLPGAMLKFDLRNGFPAMTTKKLAFGQVKGELIGFLHGCTSAEDFRDLGCTIWDANANENQVWLNNPERKGVDDLGPIYGSQWREWCAWDCDVDQVANALKAVREIPESRRIIVTAWNPGEIDKMALPPCPLNVSTFATCQHQSFAYDHVPAFVRYVPWHSIQHSKLCTASRTVCSLVWLHSRHANNVSS